jgi:hypothetical protein
VKVVDCNTRVRMSWSLASFDILAFRRRGYALVADRFPLVAFDLLASGKVNKLAEDEACTFFRLQRTHFTVDQHASQGNGCGSCTASFIAKTESRLDSSMPLQIRKESNESPQQLSFSRTIRSELQRTGNARNMNAAAARHATVWISGYDEGSPRGLRRNGK